MSGGATWVGGAEHDTGRVPRGEFPLGEVSGFDVRGHDGSYLGCWMDLGGLASAARRRVPAESVAVAATGSWLSQQTVAGPVGVTSGVDLVIAGWRDIR
ncbi:hypothetical protein GCM10022255_086560 [Dactylosporangium darangshiense]|uniref:Uncharacterized protein n=1 Tax=Dactylosporangium darangshiense TaxID=579108 RepID=A0ABP8DMT5_9ACTN